MPDPATRVFTAAEEAAWYAQLPTMFGAAAALFTDAAGRVLLVLGWTGLDGKRPRPIMYFVFDGGTLAADYLPWPPAEAAG